MNTRRLRIMTGAMTTMLFLGIGLSLLSTPDAERIGAFLCALGVVRGVFVARELIPSDDDEDPEDETGATDRP